MGSPMRTIEKDIIKKLKAGTSFMTILTGGVHSYISEKQSYPYCRVGDSDEGKFNVFGKVGKETNVRVFIYSEKQTDDELLNLVDLADDLLDDKTLTLTGWTPVLLSWESTNIITNENDGRTRYAIIVYRIISQKE